MRTPGRVAPIVRLHANRAARSLHFAGRRCTSAATGGTGRAQGVLRVRSEISMCHLWRPIVRRQRVLRGSWFSQSGHRIPTRSLRERRGAGALMRFDLLPPFKRYPLHRRAARCPCQPPAPARAAVPLIGSICPRCGHAGAPTPPRSATPAPGRVASFGAARLLPARFPAVVGGRCHHKQGANAPRFCPASQGKSSSMGRSNLFGRSSAQKTQSTAANLGYSNIQWKPQNSRPPPPLDAF